MARRFPQSKNYSLTKEKLRVKQKKALPQFQGFPLLQELWNLQCVHQRVTMHSHVWLLKIGIFQFGASTLSMCWQQIKCTQASKVTKPPGNVGQSEKVWFVLLFGLCLFSWIFDHLLGKNLNSCIYNHCWSSASDHASMADHQLWKAVDYDQLEKVVLRATLVK